MGTLDKVDSDMRCSFLAHLIVVDMLTSAV